MAGTGATPIAAPLAAPPRVGLMQAVVRPDAPDGWLNGITFDPEDIEVTYAVDAPESDYWWDACTPEATPPAGDSAKTPGTRPARPIFRPFAVIEADSCTGRWADPSRAQRKLAASTPAKVEREFWTGTLVQAAGFENDYLASATAVVLESGGLVPLAYALAALQEYAAGFTSRALIHCSPATLSLWVSAGLLRREGPLWLDAKDNIVVAGDGYDGSGPPEQAEPTGWQSWAYATGLVHYLEDAPMVLPSSIGEAFDRSTNTTTYRAERTVLPFWDTIIHGAVLVDLCNTCCDEISP